MSAHSVYYDGCSPCPIRDGELEYYDDDDEIVDEELDDIELDDELEDDDDEEESLGAARLGRSQVRPFGTSGSGSGAARDNRPAGRHFAGDIVAAGAWRCIAALRVKYRWSQCAERCIKYTERVTVAIWQHILIGSDSIFWWGSVSSLLFSSWRSIGQAREFAAQPITKSR